MEFPKRLEIAEGINVYIVNTDKFKTLSLSLFIHRPLDEYATQNSLIPLVLRRGTYSLKTFQEIVKYLEELYGAVFDCGIQKKGERHILRFYLETVWGGKIDNQDMLRKSLQFLSEIVLNPLVENDGFNEKYVSGEKDNLKRIIESKLNDKMQYSMDRCIEEMCKDEPYSIYQYGRIEDLDKIDAKNLYAYYLDILKTSPIDIFVVGDINDELIINQIKKCFNIKRENILGIKPSSIEKHIREVKKIEEKLDVNQGKLCLGFRTNTPYDTDNYYALVLYSNILGGGATSKLFLNVREKESLAYTIFSRIDKFKGLMYIVGGIDFENYQKTLDISFAQMEEIKKGNITDDECNAALKNITTSIKSLQDSHSYIVDFFLSQLISGSSHNFEQLTKALQDVKKDNITKASESIELDTIYFLNGNK